MAQEIKGKTRGAGTISARVFRKETGQWEDLGVISTTKVSLLQRIKKNLGLESVGEVSYIPLPQYKGNLRSPLPKVNGKEILRVLSKSIGETEITYNCLLDDGSIETVLAGALEEVEE